MRRALLVSLASLGALIAPGAAQATFPGENGRIAFTRDYRFCNPPDPCGKVLMSVNPDGTDAAQVASPGTRAAGSADGTKLAYTDGLRIYVSNLDGSNPTMVLDWGQPVGGLAWSPGGDKLAASLETCSDDECRPDIYTFNLDGSGLTDLTPDLLPDRDPSWSPDGSKIAFGTVRLSDYEVFVMNPDGTGATNLSNHPAVDLDPNWSPNGGLAFVRSNGGFTDIWLMDSDGGGQQPLTNDTGGGYFSPSWSPDATAIAAAYGQNVRTLHVIDLTGVDSAITPTSSNWTDDYPEWLQAGPAPPPPPETGGYPRPRGATPFKTYFVPAFKPCDNPNSTHGEPLAFGSCAPPVQASDQLTVGAPDANGAAARAVGRLWLRVLNGKLSTPWDDADAEVIFDTGDVRNAGSLTDYEGELSLATSVRITDHANEPNPPPATVEDIPVNLTVPCFATSDPDRGSSCHLDTTIDGVLGNVIVEGSRTIWELGQMQVWDGGPDGVAETHPNTLFEVQGLFVP